MVAIHSELDLVEGLLEWPTTLKQYNRLVESARQAFRGDHAFMQSLEVLEREGQRAIDETDPATLETISNGINTLWERHASR